MSVVLGARRCRPLRRLAGVGLGGLLLAAVALQAAPALAAPVFVINGLGDGPDSGATRDGICRAADGTCTLRAALMEANAASDHVTINFALPGVTDAASPAARIRITSKPPTVTNPAGVTFDGYSQVGSSANTLSHGSNAVLKVEIVGSGVANTFDGLQLNSSNNVVKGLSIYAFKHSIWIEGTSANNNVIVGNFICTDVLGVFGAQQLNGAAGGILIQNGASSNVVGTPTLADRNIVSGCAHRGVIVSFLNTANNKIQNNVFGLNPSGTAALPNQAHAIDINYGARDNLAGGLAPFERNIVSGNMQEGIEVSHGTSNRRNRVLGNCVGTDLTCTTAPTYAGNGMMGIRLEGEKDCDNTTTPPCPLNAGYAEVAYNVVVGNGWAADSVNGPPWGGILVDKGQQHDIVHDNFVGVLPDGTPAGNTGYGVRVEHHAMFNQIGPNNTIAFNSLGGVQMAATASQPATRSIYPTSSNPVIRNSIHDNGGTTGNLGIDLVPFGIPNVNGVGDPDVANGIQPPTIGRLNGTSVSGSACVGCTVEVYLADVAVLTNKPSYGEGKTFLVSAVADQAGAWAAMFPSRLAAGQIVTVNQTSGGVSDPAATSTGLFGDTSEFARDIAVGGPGTPSITAPPYVNSRTLFVVPVTGQCNSSAVSANGILTDSAGTQVPAGPVNVDSSSTFRLVFDASPLLDGPLTVSVSVADSTGQLSAAATAGLVKDTVNPVALSATPAADSTVASPSSVSTTFSEAVVGIPTATLTGPSGAVDSSTTVSGDALTITTTSSAPLGTGSWTSSVAGSDGAGNAFMASTTFTVDATAPGEPTLTSPSTVTGSTQSVVPISGTAEPLSTVQATATDASTHAASRAVSVSNSGSWSTALDLSTFDDGTVTFTATATDAVGNTSPAVTATATKVTTGPKVVSSSPTTGATTASPATGILTFDRPLTPGWTFQLTGLAAGVRTAQTVLSSDGRTLTYTPSSALASDSWTVTITASDALGGVTTSTVSFDVDAVAPVTPTLVLPVSVNSINQDAVPISGTTTAEAGDTIRLQVTGGGSTVSAVATTDETGSWAALLTLSGLPDGALSVVADAMDAVGNRSQAAVGDLSKKARSDAPGLKPASWTVNSITAAWAAPLNSGGAPVTSYELTYTAAGGPPSTVVTTALTYTVSNLSEGTAHSVTVAARTSAGLGAYTVSQTVTTKWRSSATVVPNPTKALSAGGTIMLSGKVYRTSALPTVIVGARLVVYQVNSATGARTFVVNNVITRADGTWSYSYVPPKGSWKWQVTWVGDNVNGSASSAPSGVVVVS